MCANVRVLFQFSRVYRAEKRLNMHFLTLYCKCLFINIINEFSPFKYLTSQYNYYFWCVFVVHFSFIYEGCVNFFVTNT